LNLNQPTQKGGFMRKLIKFCVITLLVLASSFPAQASIRALDAPKVRCGTPGHVGVTVFSAIIYYDALSKLDQLTKGSEFSDQERANVKIQTERLRARLLAEYTHPWGILQHSVEVTAIEDDLSNSVIIDYCQAWMLHYLFSGLETIEPKLVSGEELSATEASALLGLTEVHRTVSDFLGIKPSELYQKALKNLAHQYAIGKLPEKLWMRTLYLLKLEGVAVGNQEP